MSRSVLLQLARDSIQEVLEAQRTINKSDLLNSHPLLNEKIATTVNIYLQEELRGSYASKTATKTLLEDIIYNAKKSAFEDTNFSPLTTSDYLSCEIELLLNTPDGVLSEKDPSILK
ncbi:MAG: AMMECR1 domain-containing protein [Campylobacterota bacterium]|nr:AMMECR1 domain-containing protein [Campylobacterota bacterium]